MPVSLFVVVLQLLLTCAAGWLLFAGWRRVAAIDRRANVVTGAGFIIRALIAQGMFWVSYLQLPIARKLQAGDGFWTLAIDGRIYFDQAAQLMSHGWKSVAFVDKSLGSPVFLQTLAVFLLLFGGVASVGALLNLFAYLGSCAAILRLGRGADGRVTRPALLAVAAIAFAPGVVIWSVQPLKDALFVFAITAFVAACALWQKRWAAVRLPLLGFLP